jgi:hypothetical protein
LGGEYLVDTLDLFVGVLGGAVLGWATALIFARKQARDLDQTAERLERVSGQLTGTLRQEVLALREDVRNVHGLNVYLIELLAEAGQIEPRRDEQGNVVFPLETRLDVRWEVRTREQERIAQLEEALRQAQRPSLWRRIWRSITP